VLLLWYAGAWAMNAQGAIERVLPADQPWSWQDLLAATLSMERPVLPAPHQVAADLWASLTGWPMDSPRNLLFHVAVTGESTLWGFVMGTALGLLLAVGEGGANAASDAVKTKKPPVLLLRPLLDPSSTLPSPDSATGHPK